MRGFDFTRLFSHPARCEPVPAALREQVVPVPRFRSAAQVGSAAPHSRGARR